MRLMKVGKTSDKAYKSCFAAYMSMSCAAAFPRCARRPSQIAAELGRHVSLPRARYRAQRQGIAFFLAHVFLSRWLLMPRCFLGRRPPSWWPRAVVLALVFAAACCVRPFWLLLKRQLAQHVDCVCHCRCPGFWVDDIAGCLYRVSACFLASLPCLCSAFAIDRSCQYTSVPPVCTQAYFWNLWRLPPQVAQLSVC